MKQFLVVIFGSFLFLFLVLANSVFAQMDLSQNEAVSGDEENAVVESEEDVFSSMMEEAEEPAVNMEQKQPEQMKEEPIAYKPAQDEKRDVFEELTQTVSQVEGVSRAAEELLKLGKAKSAGQEQLSDKFREFEQEIASTISRIETFRKTTKHISSQGELFFSDWLKELEAIKNPAMRRRGITSRDKELKILSDFNGEAQKTEENLNKLIEAAGDIDRYLKFDLTAKNISSASSEFKKINTDAGKIEKGIGAMEKTLKKMSSFSKMMDYNKY